MHADIITVSPLLSGPHQWPSSVTLLSGRTQVTQAVYSIGKSIYASMITRVLSDIATGNSADEMRNIPR